MEMKTHSRSAGNDQHRARIKNRVSFSLFYCHALIFIYSYALLAAVLLLLNTAAANECWIKLKRARAREKKSSLLFRSKAPIYWRATVSPAVIYSYYVTVAWFLYYYFFVRSLAHRLDWLLGKARYLMTTSLFPQAHSVFIYARLFTSFYLLERILRRASTVSQSHYFLRVNMNLNISLSVARRSSSWLICRQRTTVSARHRRDMTIAMRIYHCSARCRNGCQFDECGASVEHTVHCCVQCTNVTTIRWIFATTRKKYNNLLFRFLFRPQCLAMVHLIPFGVELGNNRG